MTIEQREIGSVVMLDLAGDLTAENDVRLLDRVNSLVFEGHKAIGIDLGRLAHLDSAGLGTLVNTHTAVTKAGGRVALVRVTKRVSEVMAIAKLLTVFEVFDDETAALAYLSAGQTSVVG
jgi:anti-sigma B factor antagonist